MDIRNQQYEANKSFVMGGTPYRPGDPINVEKLPEYKVGQLLNQRFIVPAGPVPDTA